MQDEGLARVCVLTKTEWLAGMFLRKWSSGLELEPTVRGARAPTHRAVWVKVLMRDYGQHARETVMPSFCL